MTSATAAIVDYGMGNLRSVQNAIEHVGGRVVVVSEPEALDAYDKIILPGVGAFSEAINCLRNTGLADSLNERRRSGAQILGICLGMQLMCARSKEGGNWEGLGWFDAEVLPFVPADGLRVPHMGWNGVYFEHQDSLLTGLLSGSDAYFVHGYHVHCSDPSDVLATTEYGARFHSMIQRDNLRGIQFHPEKSQEFGLAILKNYLEMAC